MILKERLKEATVLKPLYLMYRGIKNKLTPNQDEILNEVFDYYKNRFLHYAGAFSDGMVKDEAYLFWLSHVIEKGLSMPNMRLGFGKDKVIELASKLERFAADYSANSAAYKAGVDALQEYDYVHRLNQYQLPSEINNAINPYIDNHAPTSDRRGGVHTGFFLWEYSGAV